MFRKFNVLVFVLLLASTFSIFAKKSDDIVILFTNDVHCAISETSAKLNEKYASSLGYASVAAYKNKMKEVYNAVFLVDVGDFVHGDGDGEDVGNKTKGDAIIDLMNYVGYDYVVLGNHEFIYGVGKIEDYLNKSSATFLGCNIEKRNKETNGELDKLNTLYSIKDAGGKKIAFIGLTTPEAHEKGDCGDYVILDGKELRKVLQNTIDEARKEADYVVVLGHIGLDSDTRDDSSTDRYTSQEIIADTYGIDVFLDGHSPIGVGEKIKKNKEVNTTGYFVDKEGKKVFYGHTGKYGKRLGKVVIPSDKNKPISISYINSSQIKEKDIKLDKKIKALKNKY